MTDQLTSGDHEYIEKLLPWFVNGTLDATERERVQRHLDSCKDCKHSVNELIAIETGIRAEPATPLIPTPDVDRLMASVDAGRHEPQVFFGSSGRRVATLVSVAAAIVLSVTLILRFLSEPPTPQLFETATSEGTDSPMDYVIDLTFAESVSNHESALADTGAIGISETGVAGVYRVVFRQPIVSMEELDRFTNELAARDDVLSVDVVGVQIPMSREP